MRGSCFNWNLVLSSWMILGELDSNQIQARTAPFFSVCTTYVTATVLVWFTFIFAASLLSSVPIISSIQCLFNFVALSLKFSLFFMQRRIRKWVSVLKKMFSLSASHLSTP